MKWSGVRVYQCDALASCSPSHLCLRPFGVVSVLIVGLEANLIFSLANLRYGNENAEEQVSEGALQGLRKRSNRIQPRLHDGAVLRLRQHDCDASWWESKNKRRNR